MRDYIVNQQQYPGCITNNTRIYWQMTCLSDVDTVNHKRQMGTIIVCIGVVISFVFILFVAYLQKTARLDYKVWDVDTVTAADFTVEFQITDNLWTKFCQLPETQMAECKAQHFEQFMKKEFEKIIQNEPGVLSDQQAEIKIANITFAFNNTHIIKLLKKRGAAITNAKFDKLEEINEQIQKIKEEEIANLVQPVAAFITFETQEGYERACNIKKQTKLFFFEEATREFMEEPLAFEEAPEPTNIIWENRHISGKNQFVRKVLVAISVLLFLILALVIFSLLKRTVLQNQLQYPPTTDCQMISGMFNVPEPLDYQPYQAAAYADMNNTLNQIGVGLYYCYCKSYV